MSTYSFATMFTGFGGADIGLTAAGLTPTWGIEYREDIAAVYRQNLPGEILVADVRAVDYARLPRPDWLHASPVCTRASVANSGAEEALEDGEMAAAVVRALQTHTPRWFSLENVWGYRNFAAFRLILDTLGALGYMYDFEHVNCADMGVPQTRRRLLLRAVHGALLPELPAPVRWVGWYEAIADLIPTLPDSKLAPWQLQRLPEELRTALFAQGKYGENLVTAGIGDPAMTVTANSNQTGIKAVLITGQYGQPNTTADRAAQQRDDDEPAFTVTAGIKGDNRAVLPGCRVVAMTPRCLARFQSFPDWYELPAKRTLAATGIGGAVPPLVMQRIAEQLTGE